MSPSDRQLWLERMADALIPHRGELLAIADDETALGYQRLETEFDRMLSQLRFYGAVAVEGSYLGVTIDSSREGDHRTAPAPALTRVGRPLGPVAVFGASNFPLAFGVLGNDTGSALAAGCPVVVKTHPAHIRLSVRLAEIAQAALESAGAPPGAFGWVTGLEAGTVLVKSASIAAVGFTGSQAGGLAIWRLANERDVVIPVFAEMGTVNPVILTPKAASRVEEIASGFVSSFTLGAGQYCTKPGLLFAPAGHGVLSAVDRALAVAAPNVVMLTQGIASSYASGIQRLLDAGAEILCQTSAEARGWSGAPTLLRAPIQAVRPGSALLDECFGPLAVVVEYHGRDDLLGAVGRMQGSLVASVFTGDDESDDFGRELIDQLGGQAGRVTVNDWPTGVSWTWAQHHGGPWPSTSAPAHSSVGAAALSRWVRPVTYQSVPDAWLPVAGRRENPWSVARRVDGQLEVGVEATT